MAIIKYAKCVILGRVDDPSKITKRFPNLNKRIAAASAVIDTGKYALYRNHSVSLEELHGPNQNWDAFPREELQTRHASFINSPITVDHNPDRVIGMVVDSVYVPPVIYNKRTGVVRPYDLAKTAATIVLEEDEEIVGDWVENVLAIDKAAAQREVPGLVDMIDRGEVTDTSMGCQLGFSRCSVCANDATVPEEYCNHIDPANNLKGTKAAADDGSEKLVYEQCHEVSFFEDSMILPDHLGGTAGGAGADPKAKLVQRMASCMPLIQWRGKYASRNPKFLSSDDIVGKIGGPPLDFKDKSREEGPPPGAVEAGPAEGTETELDLVPATPDTIQGKVDMLDQMFQRGEDLISELKRDIRTVTEPTEEEMEPRSIGLTDKKVSAFEPLSYKGIREVFGAEEEGLREKCRSLGRKAADLDNEYTLLEAVESVLRLPDPEKWLIEIVRGFVRRRRGEEEEKESDLEATSLPESTMLDEPARKPAFS